MPGGLGLRPGDGDHAAARQPLSGPVYLRASDNPVPDLVADLNGQVSIDLVGKIDTDAGGAIQNTFDLVPDVPISDFKLDLNADGLLANSKKLCKKGGKKYKTTATPHRPKRRHLLPDSQAAGAVREEEEAPQLALAS